MDQQAFRRPTFDAGLKHIAGVAQCTVVHYHGCLLNPYAEVIHNFYSFSRVNVSFVQVGLQRSFLVVRSGVRSADLLDYISAGT